MRRFYVAELRAGEIALDGRQSRHVRRVLRLAAGDRIVLFDGSGREAEATLTDVHGHVRAIAGPPKDARREPAVRLTIAGALPKGRRAAFMIEKLAELGVARFVPIRFERGVRLGSLSRLRRVAVEASKQCGRSTVLEIAEPADLDAIAPPFFIASPEADRPLRLCGRATVVVGPEGGLTDDEEARLRDRGGVPARLAPTLLRVETAAIVVATLALAP